MPRFRFRLATVQKLRESARDERQRLLADALQAQQVVQARESELIAERRTVERQLWQAAQPGEIDVDRMLSLERYDLLLQAERQAVAEQLVRLEAEIARRREALAEAHREVAVLDKLRERQAARFRDAQDREERKVLDEIGGRMGGMREPVP